MDPLLNFVFAAGEDNRVRAWSLQTGEAVFQPDNETRPSKKSDHLALKEFSRPVNALVMAGSGDLWVASGRDVFCFENSLQGM